MWLKKCLVISLLLIFVSTYNLDTQQFTDEELQKIAIKLRNYTVISNQLNLCQQKNAILEYEIQQYQSLVTIIGNQNTWWERNKFYIGFGCGIAFTLGITYLAIYGLQTIK